MLAGESRLMKQLLSDLLATRASQEGAAWLVKALQAAAPPLQENTLLGYYAGAGRRLGKRALALNEEEQGRVIALDPRLPLSHWGMDEAARALLLLTLAENLPPDDFREIAQKCYELGDSREQQSWLRALGMLPENERFLAAAVDACRTNIIPLFESIACENPYPLRTFPENNFNHLVMKAMFNELALERIIGLEEKLNQALSGMCNDFVSEREAAGRPVPCDIWLALAPHAEPAALNRVHRYLGHEDANHRYWAAVGLASLLGGAAGRASLSGGASGLANAHNGDSRAALQEQSKVEQEERVKTAIEQALAAMG